MISPPERSLHFPASQARLAGFLIALLWCASAQAAEWSNTEIQLQVGNLDVPSFAGGGSADHVIYTIQHASGWKYGDNFFFVDVLDSNRPGFQDFDLYSELYANLSLGKINGKAIGAGPISDVGLLGGFNWAADANVRKYVAGTRLTLDLAGFAFANLDIAALVDDSEGLASGGAPAEDNTVLIDFNFARPFKIGDADFSIEGHIEYVGERTNELGGTVEAWILAQPQLQWHLNDRIALGIEYQFWMNKLGDGDTDESTVQALLVWEF
ncbi:MAG: nucleoside-binding protein [Gammaproteobacteria bacterium]|nr:nucleoside-binding protein [Gammaproteobacteria bacterium]